MPKDEINSNLKPYKESFFQSTFLHNFITAGIASSLAVTVMAPVERVKLCLQCQSVLAETIPKPFLSAREVFTSIVKEQGFFSLWRGNMASIIRCFPYQALNFAFKDKYNSMITAKFPETDTLGRISASILAGGIGGCTSLTLVYPLDLVRTNFNAEKMSNSERLALDFARSGQSKETLRSTLINTVSKSGFFGLYRGYTFSIFGVFLYRATYFGVYDGAKLFTPQKNRSLLISFLQAEAAASISGFMSYPFDTVRRTMMMTSATQGPSDHPSTVYANSRDCIRKIYSRKGIKGFYRGAGINVFRGSGGAIMLVLYDKLQEVLWGKAISHLPISPDTDGVFVKHDVVLDEEEDPDAETENVPVGFSNRRFSWKKWNCLCRETAGLCDF